MDVAVEIQDALIRRLGADRYALWFNDQVRLQFAGDALTVTAENEFAVARLRKRLLGDLKAAAGEVLGAGVSVRLQVAAEEPTTAADGDASADDGSAIGGAAEDAAASDGDAAVGREPLGGEGAGRRAGRQRALRSTAGGDGSGLSTLGTLASSAHGRGGAKRGAGAAKNAAGRGGAAARFGRGARSASAKPEHPLRMVSADSSEESPAESTTPRSPLAGASAGTFSVGDCNRLAFTATRMVIEEPGSVSPLFFWGPAGTGKTHLLAAIRNELRRRHQLRRVVMLSAEQFTNDFTGAVRGSGLPGFRRRYRDVDALLIDDVQFVGGKRATLRELLYTVDSLLRGRCQLAFTADRPPLDLEGLNEELAGRMAGGMVCALRPLDRATRRGVLQSMVERTGTEASAEVLDRLADELAGDARILSGAVHHLHTLGQMIGRPATWEELQQSAPELISAGRPAVNLGDIQKAVCDMFGLPSGSLRSRGQQRAVSQPRMLAMYLARQYTRAAYSEIGDYFGNRSHSTVIAATKRVENWIADSAPVQRGSSTLQTRQAIEAIENLLRTG
ncbi:DnaA/Hda family protein [Candidatus Laterigemmans baculatus]|uniref:DnaA/Hda family protein n=1 Tax=Candidatus Laterigemmans baculatus TaxID=2770505 RepID=UPI0013DC4FFF|nr:DnaA/Hda family protein [Candidatus Laterigemmans baculatus]